MKRMALFDNAKLMLIFLVVFGHMVQPTTDGSREMYTIYTWIYTFHMPAFIFLAGFFAKGSGNKDYIINLAKKLILPYLIFQFVFTAYFLFIGKDGWLNAPFYPHWSLWFLFSLFCWHILLIWFSKIPAWIGITAAVVIGVLVGYADSIDQTFSLSRTFVFFPFFLAGYWLTTDTVMKWRSAVPRAASLVFMVTLGVVIAMAPEFNSDWLLGSKSYATMGEVELGGLLRFGVYVVGALMTVSVLAWIPNKHFSFTPLGGQTLYVYLLHGFIVQLFRQQNWVEINNVLDFSLYFVLSGFIVYLLSTSTIRAVTQPLIECRSALLRKQFSNLQQQDRYHTTN
ncbi:acyltransferase family protein [Halobacillus sp. Marseille-P3879]|uniref:acyltransferase family protein n=1 Tax=Halobacillus sp. Marseille-P3879 TaxID=2045014 RepID=UPI000C79B167|nr:acyltransferase family protein [Halobacillus sp. Marseille-P3879]